MSTPPRQVYDFGPFRLDLCTCVLLRNDKPVHLPAKAFEMLTLLIRNRHRIVGKEEMLTAVWPDSFVEESNLSQNIFVIRKALGEKADENTYIANFHGRGYRFVHPVEEQQNDFSSPCISSGSGRTWPRLLLAIVVPCLLGLALLTTKLARPHLLNILSTHDAATDPVFRASADSTEAYRLYQQGRYEWNKRTQDGFRRSIDYFREAIAINPNYALAFDGAADAYTHLGAYPEARVAARKALELDDTLPQAHTTLANVLAFYDWSWADAELEYRHAIRLQPNYSPAHGWYSEYLVVTGRFEEAKDEAAKSEQLDPFSPVSMSEVAYQLYMSRQFQAAIRQCTKITHERPDFPTAHRLLGLAYEQIGMPWQSVMELQKAVELSGRNVNILGELGHAYGVAGKRDQARQVLEQISPQAQTAPYHVALVYLGMRNDAMAFEWLNKAILAHNDYVTQIKVDPRIDPLRSNPRFRQLLARMRFP